MIVYVRWVLLIWAGILNLVRTRNTHFSMGERLFSDPNLLNLRSA